jgi:hypothetical protein
MRLSDGVEWGVHACTLLAAVPPDRALPAAKLAEYHGVPAAYLAKHLQALARAGVLETVKDRGGYRWRGRPPTSRCSTWSRRSTAMSPRSAAPRSGGGDPRRCPREYTRPCGINRAFLRADELWRGTATHVDRGARVGVVKDAPPVALQKGVRWLGAAVGAPPGYRAQRPARGFLPWLALLRRARSLRFFVFLLMRAASVVFRASGDQAR